MKLQGWMMGGALFCGALAISLQQPAGMAQALGNGARTVSTPPFSMTQTMTTEQTYANGLVITSSYDRRTFRDSAGRTRTETQVLPGHSPVGSSQEALMINVEDPAAQMVLNWSTQPGSERVVRVSHTNQHPNVDRIPMPAQSAVEKSLRPVQRQEDLGEKIIQGISVSGTRNTTTYPVGALGNNVEFTVIYEMWRIKHSYWLMESTQSDPRSGKSMTVLTSFTPGEPDEALFHAPTDYVVRDLERP